MLLNSSERKVDRSPQSIYSKKIPLKPITTLWKTTLGVRHLNLREEKRNIVSTKSNENHEKIKKIISLQQALLFRGMKYQLTWQTFAHRSEVEWRFDPAYRPCNPNVWMFSGIGDGTSGTSWDVPDVGL